ncbi:sulfotransferase 1 family member D1 [Galendromus occidentalis]|uniref:Sulfotransferase 1 family member D1 n=1 Tax=Galendromus occidentalis TaxID=34638 RepID=A0AAJ6VUN5_9ACAR|nr:sulfotransferase 1 family member D1 [Galendromus occidentalis]
MAKIGEPLPGREEIVVNLKPLYLDFDGTRMAKLFTVKCFREAVNYKPRPDDIFIATFPKCGTTWMSEITYLIFHHGNSPNSHLDRLQSTPFIEMTGEAGPRNMARPGCIKTHLPRNLVPYSDDAKYIYVVRNPKDCAVSYFHHQKKTFSAYEFEDGSFDEFFELFLKGETEYNDYFAHLLSWYPQTKKPNTFLIHYEDLKKDPRSEILRLGKFLGEDYYKSMLESNLIDKIVVGCHVDTMKKHYERFDIPIEGVQNAGVANFVKMNIKQKTEEGTIRLPGFVRQGKVNGWKDMFTAEMNSRMERKIFETLEPVCPEIVQKWRDHNILS